MSATSTPTPTNGHKVYCSQCRYRFPNEPHSLCLHPAARHTVDTPEGRHVRFDTVLERNPTNQCPDFAPVQLKDVLNRTPHTTARIFAQLLLLTAGILALLWLNWR